MRRFVLWIVPFSLLLSSFIPAVNAGSGSKTELKDGHTFKISYGSTEKNTETSIINYVSAEVTVPGLRFWDQICSEISIYSEGKQVYKGPQQCVQYGPGVKATSKQWFVYSPSKPNARVQVRRGKNELKVGFSYVYAGVLNGADCQKGGMCGAAWVSTKIP